MEDTLTVRHLLNALQGLDPDTPVYLATQPNYPFKHGIEGVHVLDNDPEDGDQPLNEVYLAEGEQLAYLSGDVAQAIGWRE